MVRIFTIQCISALEHVTVGRAHSCLSSCCWEQVGSIYTSTYTRPHVSAGMIKGVETQVFLSEKSQRTDTVEREKKIVTCSIMQAAHLNWSLPGTYTLRARIQPTCEWAPCHLSRWARKSAASRPCMCISGGWWGHDSQRRRPNSCLAWANILTTKEKCHPSILLSWINLQN